MSYPLGPPSVEQHCYRHADRRAGVSCQRCNRPICPSCMISASVGFQCPECTKQGAKQQRLVDVFRQGTEPRLTYALMAVNVAVFLLATATGLGEINARFGLIASNGAARSSSGNIFEVVGVGDGAWWRIVTSGFLHADIIHLGLNMYILYLIGGAMERVIGPVRFGLIYAVSLIGGSLGALLLSPDALTVGASGAIFGLFAALACLQLSRGQNPMKGGIGPTIAINLVFTFALSSFISVGGHVGGLIAGGACGLLFFGLNPAQARTRHPMLKVYSAVVAGLGLVLFVGAVLVARGNVAG